uniref:Uncharacterized protein n=1 Tax=Ananas comosus var. bracteatus TaxID=296719 RepID=A0A6V7P0P3_ANACO|nr:unnamed protein product [Ananas comosus var. bracteatus]
MAIKQKMEIKVQVECKYAKQQAMKIASQTDGVENVGVEEDKLVIIGTGIYWVRLLKLLEKKLGCIQLLTLAEVKPPPPADPKPKPELKPEPKPPAPCSNPCSNPPPCWNAPPCSNPPPICFVVDSPCQTPCSDPCSIM